MSDQQHEDHTGPIKTPKQMMWVSIVSFVAPVFIIIGLVFFVTSGKKPAAGASNMEKSVSERAQKVGTVEIRDANRVLKGGEAVYQAQCAACHGAGVAGAPKLADKAAWSARIKTGLDAMVNSALKGKGAMAAQGGGDHSDVEIARAVAYMANSAGAKFAEPKAPEAAK
ncbi:MAG: c-type cytochrome [Hylemonella sp.]|nr:c-type cytochrome [Hylemonella sp.]